MQEEIKKKNAFEGEKRKESAGVAPVCRDQVTDYLRKSLVFNLIKTI